MKRLIHLARRFFASWGSRRPDPAAQRWVATVLPRAEAALFWEQPIPDQAHGVLGASRVAAAGGSDLMVRAFLLHDIGKRHARLGTMGRSLATALDLVRIPVRGRFRTYLDHGTIGASELEAIGAHPLVVAFARFHNREAPAEIDPAKWGLLVAADRA